MNNFSFKIEKKARTGLGRAGVITTPHGQIKTPAFVAVGTQATVKALSPEEVFNAGIQAVLANTYHLYLKPGTESVKEAGGIHKFMNWNGPILTDSGGFQVFSLGAAYGKSVSKIAKKNGIEDKTNEDIAGSLVKIDEEGVDFKSVVDGSNHRFTPEKSIQIQRDIGADIIFAFDECPSPEAPKKYQTEAMERTHRWAKRSIVEHKKAEGEFGNNQALFGIVQGGRFEDLRKESARAIGKMDFDGFGIGGSFNKEDIGKAVRWVNEILPEEKPRHLLGIGEPGDLVEAIRNGCDTFDCVAPTRMARNGALHTKNGRINILNAKFKKDFGPIDTDCNCYTCKNYTKAYVAHLFRAEEMFAATLASIHNLAFVTKLVDEERRKILEG